MRITDVRAVLLTGPSTNDPYIVPFRRVRSAAFIEIETDTGYTGIGETYGGYFFPEAIPVVVEFFKPILVAAERLDIPTLSARMRACSIFWGRVGLGAIVLSGIEAALWDLRGKLEGVPVFELLGGRQHDRLLAYATGGPSPWPMEYLLEKADYYLGLGFRAFKVATGSVDMRTLQGMPVVHGEAAAELEAAKISALRRHVGPEVELLLDGHMGFKQAEETWDVNTAVLVAQALEPYRLFLFEEPLPYSDPQAYGALRSQTKVPIAGGEQLSTASEFGTYVAAGAFDIAQPDASFLSMGDFLEVGRLMGERNGKVATHAWGAGGSAMQNIHAAFATPNAVIAEMAASPGELHTEVWGDSLQMKDGCLLPPQRPGLGIRLTAEIKARYPFQPGSGEFVSVHGKVLR